MSTLRPSRRTQTSTSWVTQPNKSHNKNNHPETLIHQITHPHLRYRGFIYYTSLQLTSRISCWCYCFTKWIFLSIQNIPYFINIKAISCFAILKQRLIRPWNALIHCTEENILLQFFLQAKTVWILYTGKQALIISEAITVDKLITFSRSINRVSWLNMTDV
jgi:hypothetical protein